jgi:hypothetical protein
MESRLQERPFDVNEMGVSDEAQILASKNERYSEDVI